MIKKIVLCLLCLMFAVAKVNGMEAKKQDVQKPKPIKNFEDFKRLPEYRDQRRAGRHAIFAEEHNQGMNGLSRKKSIDTEKK